MKLSLNVVGGVAEEMQVNIADLGSCKGRGV
jgi:hypothetical protein